MHRATRTLINPWLASAARSFAQTTPQFRVGVAHDLDACASAWRLLETHAAATVFQTHAWLETWQRTVGAAQGVEPRVALVRDAEGRLVMILPLALERIMGVETLVWMARDEADYHAPLVSREFAAICTPTQIGKILHLVADLVPEAKAISLTKMLQDIQGTPNPLALAPHVPHPSSAHAISLEAGFENIYAERISKKTRRKARRRRSRLEEFGPIKLAIAKTPAEQHEMLNVILSQKAKWLADRGIKDPFAAESVQDFMHGLIDNPAARSSVHISTQLVGDEVVAGTYGYIRDGWFYAVIGSIIDGELARHAPGTLHLHEKLRWCEANGFDTYDLTIGDEGYKSDWCDQHLDLLDIRLPLTVTGYLAIWPTRAFAAAKRFVKKSPRLLAIAMECRRLARGLLPT